MNDITEPKRDEERFDRTVAALYEIIKITQA
jgi:hypothetical protein